MAVIEIEGMQFYAFHGHYESEQLVGNKFIVTIKIKTDSSMASVSDNLDDAINYQTIYTIIKNEMAVKSRLLEHVSKRILDAVYSRFPEIKKAKLKISKMNPAMGGEIEKVSVSIKR